jgi:hypothetical protein
MESHIYFIGDPTAVDQPNRDERFDDVVSNVIARIRTIEILKANVSICKSWVGHV